MMTSLVIASVCEFAEDVIFLLAGFSLSLGAIVISGLFFFLTAGQKAKRILAI